MRAGRPAAPQLVVQDEAFPPLMEAAADGSLSLQGAGRSIKGTAKRVAQQPAHSAVRLSATLAGSV